MIAMMSDATNDTLFLLFTLFAALGVIVFVRCVQRHLRWRRQRRALYRVTETRFEREKEGRLR